MPVQLDIQLADDISESIEEPPSSRLLNTWAQAAWQGEDSSEPVLSLRIVSAAESQQLNNDYRGKNKPTNVLSFPMQIEQQFDDVPMADMMLGDLAICAEVVEREALQQHKTTEAHWAHMVVHGMLHLQGYDHIEEQDAQQMESLETAIMQQLGFLDPYQMNNDLNESSKTEQKT
ncbi:MAG: rRNA maturation RNase YbeY [Gammaproteobacteria bacterium]|nr:rRNA maturation RNase YbeY [Gammaproteobacteria bacterium]